MSMAEAARKVRKLSNSSECIPKGGTNEGKPREQNGRKNKVAEMLEGWTRQVEMGGLTTSASKAGQAGVKSEPLLPLGGVVLIGWGSCRLSVME